MPDHISTKFAQVNDPGTFALQSFVGQNSGSTISFVHGVSGSFTIPTTGVYTAPLTWTLTAGELPPGLSFSAGTISGTPTAVGTSEPITFQAVDSSTPNRFATAAFVVTVS